MIEVKIESVFKKGRDRRRYTKNFYGENLDNVFLVFNTFVEQMKSKGWQLFENKVLSIRKV